MWPSSRPGARLVRTDQTPGFGDIFFQNGPKNGLLAIHIASSTRDDLRAQCRRSPGVMITVDLPAQTLAAPDGRMLPFEIDDFRKQCLMRSIDDIDFTFDHIRAIGAWEARRDLAKPWARGVTDPSQSSGPLMQEARVTFAADIPSNGAGDIRAGHTSPLAGIKVLELAHIVAGPSARQIFADLGADVIKFEPVEGGDRSRRAPGANSAMLHFLNRNKQIVYST